MSARAWLDNALLTKIAAASLLVLPIAHVRMAFITGGRMGSVHAWGTLVHVKSGWLALDPLSAMMHVPIAYSGLALGILTFGLCFAEWLDRPHVRTLLKIALVASPTLFLLGVGLEYHAVPFPGIGMAAWAWLAAVAWNQFSLRKEVPPLPTLA